MAEADDVRVTASLRIPRGELTFQFSRSGGPGGQNVNKVNSRVQLRWNILETGSLPPAVRQRLQSQARRRITAEGELLITSQRYRDQSKNIDDCLEKLCDLVRLAAIAPVQRKATRPSAGAKRRRLKAKKERSERKQSRRLPERDD